MDYISETRHSRKPLIDFRSEAAVPLAAVILSRKFNLTIHRAALIAELLGLPTNVLTGGRP